MSRLVEALEEIRSWALTTWFQAALLILIMAIALKLLGERLAARWRAAFWMLVAVRLALPSGVAVGWSSMWRIDAPRFLAGRDPADCDPLAIL